MGLRRAIGLWAASLLGTCVLAVAGLAAASALLPGTRPFIRDLPEKASTISQAAWTDIRRPVRKIVVAGNRLTPTRTILQDLNVEAGDSLWFFSSRDAYRKIRSLPLVASAEIRQDDESDTITVKITERDPIAMWQHRGNIALINEKGEIISLPEHPKEAGIDLGARMPLAVGDDANIRIAELLDYLKPYPKFRAQVASYARIGGRRWNIDMTNGAAIMLPEEDWQAPLGKFLRLDRKAKILASRPAAVDLRIPGQITVRKSANADNGADASPAATGGMRANGRQAFKRL